MPNNNFYTVLDKLVALANERDLKAVRDLYHKEAVLIPSKPQTFIRGAGNIMAYYEQLLDGREVITEVIDTNMKFENGNKVVTGICHVSWEEDSQERLQKTRISLLLQDDKILVHHATDMIMDKSS